MNAADNNSSIIFLHMPKAAGSTLCSLIDRLYESDDIFQHDVETAENRGSIGKMPLENLHAYKVVRGHIPFHMFKKLWPEQAPFSFTILREPVARVISSYHYLLRMPNNKEHALARQGIGAFIEQSLQADNLQTRYLCNHNHWTIPKGECTPELLEQAQQNIRQRIDLVGVSELFDAFLVQLERRLEWPARAYRKINVTQKRTKRQKIAPEVIDRIRAMNQLDAELYQTALSIQKDAIETLPPAFRQKIKRLKQKQTILNIMTRLPFAARAARVFHAVKSRK